MGGVMWSLSNIEGGGGGPIRVQFPLGQASVKIDLNVTPFCPLGDAWSQTEACFDQLIWLGDQCVQINEGIKTGDVSSKTCSARQLTPTTGAQTGIF